MHVGQQWKKIFSAKIDSVQGYSEGFWYLSLANGRRIYVDIHGKELPISNSCQPAGTFSEGLAPVRIDQKEGYIDASGKLVIAPQWDHVENFSDGVASVVIKGEHLWGCGWVGRKGVIDRTGKVIFEHSTSP